MKDCQNGKALLIRTTNIHFECAGMGFCDLESAWSSCSVYPLLNTRLFVKVPATRVALWFAVGRHARRASYAKLPVPPHPGLAPQFCSIQSQGLTPLGYSGALLRGWMTRIHSGILTVHTPV